MTTSGTTSYNLEVVDIITQAFGMLGKLPEQVEGWMIRDARIKVNLMFSAWANKGITLWRVEKRTAIPVVAKSAYELPSGTIDVLEVTIKIDDAEITIGRLSRENYVQIPNKLLPGRPTAFYVDRQREIPVINFWPVPDTIDNLITIYRLRQFEDVTASAQTADIPYRWLAPMVTGLAAWLAPLHAPDRLDGVAPIAEQTFNDAKREDRERVTTRIVPDLHHYTRI